MLGQRPGGQSKELRTNLDLLSASSQRTMGRTRLPAPGLRPGGPSQKVCSQLSAPTSIQPRPVTHKYCPGLLPMQCWGLVTSQGPQVQPSPAEGNNNPLAAGMKVCFPQGRITADPEAPTRADPSGTPTPSLPARKQAGPGEGCTPLTAPRLAGTEPAPASVITAALSRASQPYQPRKQP